MRLLDQVRSDRVRISRLLVILALMLLPAVLAILGYYRHKFEPSQVRWQLTNDSAFHLYQLSRGAELSGRWWKVADEGRVGRPYPLEVFKHPGIYEGVDVMLLSAASGRLLGPIANYHFMILVILCINGWIAGWAVYRSTRSLFWSAIAMILITLNVATAMRIQGHLNLFKYGWTILAVIAFSRYLDWPTKRNGLLLGLASAWVFQGAFYSGCFIVLGLGVWWLGCLVAGKLRRDHYSSAMWATLAYAVLFVALMFPVFLTAKKQLLNDVYSMRPITDVWLYSSELWQYLMSPTSRLAQEYVASLSAHHRAQFHEGWNYMGLTVIAACGLYVVLKLRGKPLPISDPKLIDRMMGLIVLFVVLSLCGGPSFLIHEYLDSLRAYGRSGLMALALWCVATPILLHGLISGLSRRSLRGLAAGLILCLSLFDGYRAQQTYAWRDIIDHPSWVDWMASQPPGKRIAAFPPYREDSWNWWGMHSLLHSRQHKGAQLNGCDMMLLEADLGLVGASYARMNHRGLRYIYSLGYDHLAFHDDYIKDNCWIPSVPWMNLIERRRAWQIFQVNGAASRLPSARIHDLVGGDSLSDSIKQVPPRTWITDQINADRDVLVLDAPRIRIVWVDREGRRVSKPANALFQHIYGPNQPAYSIKTPKAPGRYQLVFIDERGQTLGAKMYEVTTELKVAKQTLKSKLNSMTTHLCEVKTSVPCGGAIRVTIENNTDFYIQAQADRDAIGGASVRSHPTICGASLGSMLVDFQAKGAGGGMTSGQSSLFLPRDLPPWTRIEMEIGSDQVPPLPGNDLRLLIRPQFVAVGSQLVNASEHADLHISSVLISPVAASDGSRNVGDAGSGTLIR